MMVHAPYIIRVQLDSFVDLRNVGNDRRLFA
jgi:hypothetical protein